MIRADRASMFVIAGLLWIAFLLFALATWIGAFVIVRAALEAL